jgi:hypothetical protein
VVILIVLIFKVRSAYCSKIEKISGQPRTKKLMEQGRWG